jgi:TctA family transporter
MTERLPLVFVLIWSLFLSNWMTSIVGLLLVRPLARLTTVRVQMLVPVVLGLAILGAFAHEQRIGDVVLAFVFGIGGYYMKKHGWPRIPLVVALLLGAGIERNLHITARLLQLGRLDAGSRPILLALTLLILVNLALPWWQASRRVAPAGSAS